MAATAGGPLETLARLIHLGAHNAALGVVVDQAHGLHEGEDRGGAHELPAALFQVFGHGHRHP